MRDIRVIGLVFIWSLWLFACGSTQNEVGTTLRPTQVETVDYFTDTGLSNPIASLQHPAGEHANGVTYITYQGLYEDPYVAAYNHHTSEWQGPFKAGVSDMGKDPNRKIDNHGKPAMIIDDLGYIHIAFGGHGGVPSMGENTLGNYNYGRLQHVVSKRPYDITEWEYLDNVSPFGTYNQWVKMSNGDLYLIYRHGAHQSDWVYQKSTDHGRTFSPPVSILKTQRRQDGQGVDAWYAWFGEAADDNILVSYNYHLCGNSHPNGRHLGARFNGYYMQLDTKTDTWSNVNDVPLSLPVTRDIANEMTQVVNTEGTDDWTGYSSVYWDQLNHPHVRFSFGNHSNRHQVSQLKPRYFRWDGERWNISEPNQLPVSKGDANVMSDTHTSLLLASKGKNNTHVISWWNTSDGGNTFTQGDEVLSTAKGSFAVSSFIRNAHPDALLIASEKVKGTHLRRMFLVGENGPVQRSTATAHHTTEAQRAYYEIGNDTSDPNVAFEKASGAPWQQVLFDEGTGDWQDHWFSDGLVGTIENTPDGMHISAGPEAENHAHHFVVWSKQAFSGDVKVEYDFTRTDDAELYVNILYLLATGEKALGFDEDIMAWRNYRDEPYMRHYFDNMNTYHISYAAFGLGEPDAPDDYVRARRYLPLAKRRLAGTALEGDNINTGFFEKGVPHHITVIKRGDNLWMQVENAEQKQVYRWQTNSHPNVEAGRIGLRHMYTRSALYKNFTVSVLK
ncbi:DUF1961 family protein [Alteromonas sp. KUL49]|uniref:DUF1961 family protein n=1 Tax=Alteromonas sp. KUL49 TaxID=2480798 RepID=UPI0010FFC662|nr:DUF1961 family protein [Alteromonas sp. KUL49]GEA09928.1 hypothetical protein KUL49_03030 [Alteromonas sp. KUL49]